MILLQKLSQKYIVYHFTVDGEDRIIFEGLKKSDMATRIIGKISSGETENDLQILSDNINKGDVTILKPIL